MHMTTEAPPREVKVRLSITLPHHLAVWVRQRAELDGTTISAVIEKAIRQRQAVDRTARR